MKNLPQAETSFQVFSHAFSLIFVLLFSKQLKSKTHLFFCIKDTNDVHFGVMCQITQHLSLQWVLSLWKTLKVTNNLAAI